MTSKPVSLLDSPESTSNYPCCDPSPQSSSLSVLGWSVCSTLFFSHFLSYRYLSTSLTNWWNTLPFLTFKDVLPFMNTYWPQALSSCSEQGLLFTVVSLFAEHRLQGSQASVVLARRLSSSTHVGSSWTRDRTCVPCIGRQILNYWTTKEVFSLSFPRELQCQVQFLQWLLDYSISSCLSFGSL